MKIPYFSSFLLAVVILLILLKASGEGWGRAVVISLIYGVLIWIIDFFRFKGDR
jgi:hypothetical protein